MLECMAKIAVVFKYLAKLAAAVVDRDVTSPHISETINGVEAWGTERTHLASGSKAAGTG